MKRKACLQECFCDAVNTAQMSELCGGALYSKPNCGYYKIKMSYIVEEGHLYFFTV